MNNQLNKTCNTKTTPDTHVITESFLCACKNFCMGKFRAYAYNCGIIHNANFPAPQIKQIPVYTLTDNISFKIRLTLELIN